MLSPSSNHRPSRDPERDAALPPATGGAADALRALRALSRSEAPEVDRSTLRELVETGCVSCYSREEHAALREEAARLPEVRGQLSIAAARAHEISSWAEKLSVMGRTILVLFGSSGSGERFLPGEPAELRRLVDEARDRQQLECKRLERLASRIAGAVESEHGALVITEHGQRMLPLLEAASARLSCLALRDFIAERREREDKIGVSLTRFLGAFAALGEDGRDRLCIEGAIALSAPGGAIAENLRRFTSATAALKAAGAGESCAREIALELFGAPESRISQLSFVASKLGGTGTDTWRLARELLHVPGRTVKERLATTIDLASALYGSEAVGRADKNFLLLVPAARAASFDMSPELTAALYSDVACAVASESGCPGLSRGLRREGSRAEWATSAHCVVELLAGCRPPYRVPAGELARRFVDVLACLENHGLSRRDETAPLMAARIARLPGSVAENVEDLERIFQRLDDMDVYLTMMAEISLGVLENALASRRPAM